MKFLIILTAVFGFACSHGAKKEAPASATPTASATNHQVTQAQPTHNETAPSTEKKSKRHEKTVEKSATVKAPSNDKASGPGEVKCSSGTDERSIVVAKTDQGCEVSYTKAGKTNSIANGGADMKHCIDVSEKIKKNLEGAGFTCK